MLEEIQFEDGTSVLREGGFITTEWILEDTFKSSLEYTLNEQGGGATDNWQRTETEEVYMLAEIREWLVPPN